MPSAPSALQAVSSLNSDLSANKITIDSEDKKKSILKLRKFGAPAARPENTGMDYDSFPDLQDVHFRETPSLGMDYPSLSFPDFQKTCFMIPAFGRPVFGGIHRRTDGIWSCHK